MSWFDLKRSLLNQFRPYISKIACGRWRRKKRGNEGTFWLRYYNLKTYFFICYYFKIIYLNTIFFIKSYFFYFFKKILTEDRLKDFFYFFLNIRNSAWLKKFKKKMSEAQLGQSRASDTAGISAFCKDSRICNQGRQGQTKN